MLCRHRKRPCKHLGNLMESAKSIVALSAVPFSDMTPTSHQLLHRLTL